MEGLAVTVKKAAEEGNLKQLYDTTKMLAGKRINSERSVKTKKVNQ